ncbi:class I adenylate-forming enzyme family protein [Aquipuribacter hungaricus]|uniref:Class I adenylate-forming enzyme family protein n=1 Tax=Aquipuribacter hungaricus TaxID=545624 RepID=A0ABV7WFS3_9MICO
MTDRDLLAYDRDAVRVVREPWLGREQLSYADPRPHDVLDVLDLAVHRHPDAVAVVDALTGRARTVAGLADDVAVTTAALRGAGVKPGDGVGLAAANSGAHLATILACAATGAVAVGLSSRLATPQWRYQLEHSGCRLLVHDDSHADQARDAVQGLDGVRAAGWLGTSGAAPDTAPAADGRWADLARDRVPADPAAAYQVVWTSGSTGRPKASQVVHRASVHSGIAYDRLLRLQPGESSGVLFSLGYISAMHAHVVPALLSGARLVMLPTGSARTWVEQLAAFDVAFAYAVPSWWQASLREPGLVGDRLPLLRLAGAGGSPFPDALRDGLADRLPRTTLMNVYGLSETHSPATTLRGPAMWAHPGAAGRPLEVVEVEVRDEHGTVLPDGEPGEVWLAGSLLSTGYAADPVATAAAYVDGWLRTGDVGVLEPSRPQDGGQAGDRAGEDDGPVLRLLDRVKDLVNRAGTKVYSAEVERVLDEHPAVVGSACVAAPDPRSGETVAVFLVRDPDLPAPSDAQVRAWVRERLGTAAVPSTVRWVDELPRGGTGKTDKGALRAALTVPQDR